jgi:hypothetical protein
VCLSFSGRVSASVVVGISVTEGIIVVLKGNFEVNLFFVESFKTVFLQAYQCM